MNVPVSIKKNINIFIISDFLWNLGRTVPHAVLTVYLLGRGVTLQEIALLQIVYMTTLFILEFPSGILSDNWSRKRMYIISIFLILLGYSLIYISTESKVLLYIAWILYGASAAFKSGTLESEIINELNAEKKNLKKFTELDSYALNISSALGAIIGSVLFKYFIDNIYLISIFLFIGSIVVSLGFKQKNNKKSFKKEKEKEKFQNHNILKTTIYDTINSIAYFFKNPRIFELILLYASLSFFLQPFFQYWQVLYQQKNISISYFGYTYVIFQLCNILGIYIFSKIKYKQIYSYPLLLLVNISAYVIMEFSYKITFFLLFPITLCFYYIYYQNLLVEIRKNSPASNISTLNSLIGTLMNLSSIFVLSSISFILSFISVIGMFKLFYFIFLFLSFSIMIWTKYRINKRKKINSKKDNLKSRKLFFK
ncbi:MFS transporter [Bacillus subtilis]|nr:MFS transporter [Bacillus subtilis]